MTNYLQILKQYWGYDSFRGVQEDIIRSIGSGHDTLGLMPTGGGKSITFQVPTMAMNGLCIVITPLIALMKDQVQNLRSHNIKATAIYSGMTRHEILTALDNCIFGGYKFLYISPERIGSELFKLKIKSIRVCLITVDEAHCISQWGYDFRPSYLKITEIRKLIPGVPVLALTATATPDVVKDIQRRLAFTQENVFSMSFERSNLAYVVRRTENKIEELKHILRSVPGSAIVYIRNRQKSKDISQLLNDEGFSSTFYHAGLNIEEKDQRQEAWVKNEYRIMVSTNAFGMGIDKPDVRLVIHLDFPDSPEAYYQEAGRAGRDGQKSYAVLLYAKSDKTIMRKRIADAFPEKDYIRQVYAQINYYYQMAMGDGRGCTYAFNMDQFCHNFKHFPIRVDSALNILTRAGYLEYISEQDNTSRLLFTLRKDELYRLHETDEDTERLISSILRSYSGLFSEYVYINEASIASRTGLSYQEVYEKLVYLSKCHIIDYIPGKKTPSIFYSCERRDTRYIYLGKEVYDERKESYSKRIEAMLEYAEAEDKCRSRMLLMYFGEKNEHNCGQCDVCLQKHTHKISQEEFRMLKDAIIADLEQNTISPQQLINKHGWQYNAHAKEVISYLISEEIIILHDGSLQIKK